MTNKIKKTKDLDLALFLDIVEMFKAESLYFRIRLIKNGCSLQSINQKYYSHKNQLNNLIKRLQKRLNIVSIDNFLLNDVNE